MIDEMPIILLCSSMQFPPEAWLRIEIDNGSISEFEIMPNGLVVMRSVNNNGHFCPDEITLS